MFGKARSDVVLRPRVCVRAKRIDQVAVGRDVLQSIEGGGAAFKKPLGREVLKARSLIRPERRHQIAVGSDVLESIDGGQVRAQIRITPLGPARVPVMRERVDCGRAHIGL